MICLPRVELPLKSAYKFQSFLDLIFFCCLPMFVYLLFVYLFIFERERETETRSVSGGEAEREGDTESEAGSRL